LPLLCGLGSILLLYLFIQRIFDAKTAFLSSIFLAVNPLFFLMSRQLRPEIFVAFFTILSFYLFSIAKEKKNLLFYFLIGISSALSFLSHYYGAFLIGAFGLYLLFECLKTKSKLATKTLLIFCLGVILVIFPFFIWVFRNFEIFKIQFLGNVPNLTGLQQIVNSFIKEQERYLKYPKALGLMLFTFWGLFLYWKDIFKKMPEILIFIFVYLFGLALFMPNKTLIYLTPILFITSLGGALLLARSVNLVKGKLKFLIKASGIVFLFISIFYIINPQNLSAYFKTISFEELNYHFQALIEKYYLNGKIVGDPTYFLFLKDAQKEKFLSEHVIKRWLKENEINQVFKKENINIFVYSPYWWKDQCKDTKSICDNLENFLKNQGVLLGQIERNASLVDYVYLINYD